MDVSRHSFDQEGGVENVCLRKNETLVQGDITREDVHAIVNAANKSLLQEEALVTGPRVVTSAGHWGDATGDAKLTKGYGSDTAGPVYKTGKSGEPRDRKSWKSPPLRG